MARRQPSTATTADSPSPDIVARIYRQLRKIRRAEETIAAIYPSDKIKSPVHLSIGQESVSVAVCDVLHDEDGVAATYRGHAAYLARGGSLAGLMAELFGKADGVAAGKGGSMHLVAMERNFLGTSAIVGTTIPLAVGFALANRQLKRKSVVASFFGDGATEEGVFLESVNFAALHRLPVLFVCENNGYAIHQPLEKRWATDKLCERIATYDVPARRIADGDVFAIRAAAAAYVEAMRASGAGPAFLECRTYRWREHVGPGEDFDAGYRSREDAAEWFARDPVRVTGAMLPGKVRDDIDAAIEQEIADAMAAAEASPFPEAADLYRHDYAD